jgi:hypothetical protein
MLVIGRLGTSAGYEHHLTEQLPLCACDNKKITGTSHYEAEASTMHDGIGPY